MEALLIALAGLVGYVLFSQSKRQSAEALLENQKTKEELNSVTQNLSKNTGLLEAEELKRKELENDPKQDDSSITDFFNKR